MSSKYRPQTAAQKLIALSISYERESILRRGMRIEHLRELLIGIAGTLIRGSANLAYGGHWRESPDNFTYELLQLISAERDDQAFANPTGAPMGCLFNHLAWPRYSLVTPQIEAQWIHCCRIIRITQEDAGIPEPMRIADPTVLPGGEQAILNSAITMSAMRRIATRGMTVSVPGVPPEQHLKIPPLNARIFLGGKTRGYSGFLPGLFEEALFAFENSVPLYILGGFGGAARVLVDALLAKDKKSLPQEMTLEWHEHHNPQITSLNSLVERTGKPLPQGARTTKDALQALNAEIAVEQASLATRLKTGLTEDETIELMTTIDIRRAVHLTLKGIMPDPVPTT